MSLVSVIIVLRELLGTYGRWSVVMVMSSPPAELARMFTSCHRRV